MPFDDLLALYDPTLPLPYDGKTYRVPAPTEDLVTRLHALNAVLQAGTATDEQARIILGDEWKLEPGVLGPVYDEMTTDGVPWVVIRHAARTAYAWMLADNACHHEQAVHAQERWRSLGEAVTPSTSRATATPSAEAPGTKPPSRGSGTSRPRQGRRGRTSSADGPTSSSTSTSGTATT